MWNKNVEDYLKNIDDLELIRKIKHFRTLDFEHMSEIDVGKAIENVLCFDGVFPYIGHIGEYLSGTVFFRIRKLKGTANPNPNLSKISDFWNPPEECIHSYGRINKPHESLLYTSPLNPRTCIGEMKINNGEHFALIKYIAKDKIKVNIIGGNYNYDSLRITNHKAIFINEILSNFLRDEFSRYVGQGTEYLYRISEIIAKDYFDLPPREVQDAWSYPSIQNKQNYNVCFRPDVAKELLNLQGAAICILNDDSNIGVKCISNGFDNKGIAQYYELGSEMQKAFFPEIASNIE